MPISGRSLPQSPAHLSSLNSSSFRSYLSEAQSIASRTCVAARAKDLHVNAHLSWRSVGARQNLPTRPSPEDTITLDGGIRNHCGGGREALRGARHRAGAGRAAGNGYLQGNGYVVTWAIGHLVALAQPHEIDPEWRHWRRELLPMLPREWPLVVSEKTGDQFDVVPQVLNRPRSRGWCAPRTPAARAS